jgi:hypothetical protein
MELNREGGGAILIPPGLFPSPTILIAPGISPYSPPLKAGKKLFRNGSKRGPSFLKSPQAGECQFDSAPANGVGEDHFEGPGGLLPPPITPFEINRRGSFDAGRRPVARDQTRASHRNSLEVQNTWA